MTGKSEKRKNRKIEFFKSAGDSGSENDFEKARRDAIDAEVENIFDDLRLIVDPRKHSLDEALAKAIAAEKKAFEKASKAANKNLFFDGRRFFSARFKRLQIPEFMICLLLTVMAVSIMSWSSPTTTNSESIAGGANKGRIDFR